MTQVRRIIGVLVAVLLTATACSGNRSTETSASGSSIPAEMVVTGVVFTEPLLLDEVRALASEAGATLVALWRAEAVCMPDPGRPPGLPPEPGSFASAFAYLDADEIKAIQDQGPPATDGGWSDAMRSRFVEEWEAAQEPGVLFTAAALVLPDSSAPLPGVERSAVLESYQTDVTNVLYLRGHDQAFAVLFDAPTSPDC